MEPATTTYRFDLPHGRRETFVLEFEPDTYRLVRPERPVPEWAALDFERCSHCTVDGAQHAACPLAASIAEVVTKFDGVLSHHEVRLEVTTAQRTITQTTTAQRAVGSLMGLVIPTSGCPHTAAFRPMARFHLPLADPDETAYRVASMYVLAQSMKAGAGGEPDRGLDGLAAIYDEIHKVNVAVAKRLRAATQTDSSVNALVMLDVFAIDIPFSIDDTFERMRPLFRAYSD
jgi:hypothetical protein